MLPDFLTMMNAMLAFQNTMPGEVEVSIKDGILSVQTYVGMENQDLLRDARAMFAPAE